jgi:hypothetical protein
VLLGAALFVGGCATREYDVHLSQGALDAARASVDPVLETSDGERVRVGDLQVRRIEADDGRSIRPTTPDNLKWSLAVAGTPPGRYTVIEENRSVAPKVGKGIAGAGIVAATGFLIVTVVAAAMAGPSNEGPARTASTAALGIPISLGVASIGALVVGLDALGFHAKAGRDVGAARVVGP